MAQERCFTQLIVIYDKITHRFQAFEVLEAQKFPLVERMLVNLNNRGNGLQKAMFPPNLAESDSVQIRKDNIRLQLFTAFPLQIIS